MLPSSSMAVVFVFYEHLNTRGRVGNWANVKVDWPMKIEGFDRLVGVARMVNIARDYGYEYFAIQRTRHIVATCDDVVNDKKLRNPRLRCQRRRAHLVPQLRGRSGQDPRIPSERLVSDLVEGTR